MNTHPNRTKRSGEKAVMVTTLHRGVFFGYADEKDIDGVAKTKSLNVRRCRNCISWASSNKGFLGGDGSGYGDGSGDGDGDGSGYGDGSGDGSGYGSGDGSKEYWLAVIRGCAEKWSAAAQARLHVLIAAKVQIAFWRSTGSGHASNGGGKITPAAPGVIHIAPGPLKLCEAGTLHATLLPPKWKGERWWVVALHGNVIGDEEKYGCLKREIIAEV